MYNLNVNENSTESDSAIEIFVWDMRCDIWVEENAHPSMLNSTCEQWTPDWIEFSIHLLRELSCFWIFWSA